MNELTPDTILDSQVKIIEEALEPKHDKKCHRCLRDIETVVVTDYGSEGDGMSAEAEAGHSEDCPLNERVD